MEAQPVAQGDGQRLAILAIGEAVGQHGLGCPAFVEGEQAFADDARGCPVDAEGGDHRIGRRGHLRNADAQRAALLQLLGNRRLRSKEGHRRPCEQDAFRSETDFHCNLPGCP